MNARSDCSDSTRAPTRTPTRSIRSPGYVSAQKVPDRWVATTCGYCSVGCGMFIGVKDGRAVSVRGNPDHPVNRGMLCPKGLSEHHTIGADNRAQYPLLRRDGDARRA